MWVADGESCCAGPNAAQFTSYAEAAGAASVWPRAEVRIHPSGIGWAVWVA